MRDNLNGQETRALKGSTGNKGLMISKTDKGDAKVVIATIHHLVSALKHLSDRSTYG